MQSRVVPYQSYVLGVRVKDPLPDGLYWDTEDPYHYTRIADSADPYLVIVGGEDHHTGKPMNTRESFHRLERYARDRYRVDRIEYRWSHEHFVPADGLPYIGRMPFHEHTFVATGFSGDGLTFGTVSAMILSDLIMDREHPWADLFSPGRVKPLVSLPAISTVAANVAKHYIGDRLGKGDVRSLDEIPRGEGATVSLKGKKFAVYRGDDNGLTILSPVCRHKGCIVHWNSAAKTWDCPCHGGRYDAQGRVIAGPPMESLPIEPIPRD